MEVIEVDGLRIAYERAGAGPPLILLHGYVGDDPATWRQQIDGLCGELTVVAWDAPGAGRSSDPPESFGMAGYADCRAGFIDRLGLGQPHVAGLSFGGALALGLYRRHRATPLTLTLASAYAGWAGSSPADVLSSACGKRLRWPACHPANSPVHCCRRCSPRRRRGRPSMSSAPACWRSTRPASGRWRASAENLREVLPQITIPTLLVYGGQDVRAPLTVAEDLHAAISGSALVVLPGTGHLGNIEAPEAFNRAVRNFLHARRS